MKAALCYDKKLRWSWNQIGSSSWSVSGNDIISARGVDYLIKEISGWEGKKDGHEAEKLFYLVLENNILGGFSPYPPCDTCLFLANAIHAMWPENEEIHVASWQYAPVAILLAALGHTTSLPISEKYNMEPASRLLNALNSRLKSPSIKLGNPNSNCFSLLPFASLARSPANASAPAPALLTGKTDELGNAKLAPLRTNLLASFPPSRIIELPAPSRMAQMKIKSSMFAMILDGSNPSETIHICKLDAKESGYGMFNQQKALDLFFGTAESEFAINIPVATVAANEIRNLSWNGIRQAASQPICGNIARLGDYVKILRCQLPRERINPAELEELRKESGKNPPIGFFRKGAFIAREVNQQDMDPLTGILSPTKGSPIRVFFGASESTKFLLREKDILFAFRGTENGIGASGYVQNPGLPAITSRYIYIIRALEGISPVWLYYTLKSESTRNMIRNYATGSPQLAINVDTLRQLPLKKPDPEEVARLENAHKSIAADWEQIEKIYARMDSALISIGQPGLKAMRDLGIEIRTI